MNWNNKLISAIRTSELEQLKNSVLVNWSNYKKRALVNWSNKLIGAKFEVSSFSASFEILSFLAKFEAKFA